MDFITTTGESRDSRMMMVAITGTGIDLVDFIDGWRCYRRRLLKNAGLTYSDVELATLVKLREYAYATPTTDTICF